MGIEFYQILLVLNPFLPGSGSRSATLSVCKQNGLFKQKSFLCTFQSRTRTVYEYFIQFSGEKVKVLENRMMEGKTLKESWPIFGFLTDGRSLSWSQNFDYLLLVPTVTSRDIVTRKFILQFSQVFSNMVSISRSYYYRNFESTNSADFTDIV